MSEELVVRHCAPTLAGLKTGNMFNCKYNSKCDINKKINKMNKALSKKGLRVLPLKFSNNKALIYIYRPNSLNKDFFNEKAMSILNSMGYDFQKPQKCIVQLIDKLRCSSVFPHEIGLFLGYPPEDVEGFISNNASSCKCVGHWKVYGDETRAKKCFCQYRRCTNNYYKKWSSGVSVEQLTAVI